MENKYSFKKLLKLGLISWVVLFIVVTGIGLLFPGYIRVSRTVNVNAAADSVRLYVNDLSKLKLWIEGGDSAVFVVLSRETKGAGAKIKMGSYEVSLISSTKDSVNAYWKGDHSNPMTSTFLILADTTKHASVVSWTFTQHIPWYPWERLSSMMNDKILGTPMDLSLSNLKKLCEMVR